MARLHSQAIHGFVFFALCTAALVLPASGQSVDPDKTAARPAITGVSDVPRAVHDAMQSRLYQDAVKVIETELQKEAVASPDYLHYLKAVALSHADQRDDAFQAFLELEQKFPESPWISRSRFGRAAIAVMNRQYDQAGEIYRREAERLLSHGRKDELAKIYLEFADRFFAGVDSNEPSQVKPPDYRQALEYYRESEKLQTTLGQRQQIEFQIARCFEELSEYGEAIVSFEQFQKRYAPYAKDANATANQRLMSECMYRLGHCQLRNNQPSAARRTWQDFIANEAIANDQHQNVADRLAEAKYRLAHTYGLPSPATVGDLELAVSFAEQFLAEYPNHELAAQAELEIAKGYQRHGRHTQAVEGLNSMLTNSRYQESSHLAVARQMLGESYLAQNEFDRAIESWKEFLEKHPTNSQWPEVQQRIISTEYAAAEHARVNKDHARARALWQTFMNKYPLDSRAPKILFRFGEMNYQDAVQLHQTRTEETDRDGLSTTEVELGQDCRDLFENSISDWQRLVAKYPDTEEASMAALWIGITLDERLGRRKEAIDAYKKVGGTCNRDAQQRIVRLTEPELRVMTMRKFRSNEKASVRLTTRNLEQVTVAVYSIDMNDYFRKMHLATGVEELDIALIDPDQQFNHPVKNYESLKLIEQEVEIPLDGPGVTAVTVSSDQLQATTMVVISDLDILVKSSRNEVFLFAQNMRTGKPAIATSVLISDGESVFQELQTDENGIARTAAERLRDISDLRVFAVNEGHVASTDTSLSGLDYAVGMVSAGYLFTDRPVYRPGELVNLKGIVRWVDRDRLMFRHGERFTLDIYDSRGRRLKSEQVALNAFGTLHTHLLIPESAVAGQCRIHLHRPSTPNQSPLSFESQFEIKQFTLEPVQLSIETDREVYFRGDEITATVSLQYYYGAPLSKQQIVYSIAGDDEIHQATTGDDGTVELKFATRRFSESQPIVIQMECPQQNVRQSKLVYLATRGFAVDVSMARAVFLAGETFDATVKVADPAGKPVATQLKLEVFEITKDLTGNQTTTAGERLVQTLEVTTDAKLGSAIETLTVDHGGMYIVRATGIDQFKNAVSGQSTLQISGDEDNTRLRILADQHHYRVGDRAQIRLHWRDQPALALITFDGAEVLDYRLVPLQQGENTIEIPIEAELAPNFYLTANVMQPSRLHEAVSGFVVAKNLQIKLTPSTTELKPDERVQVAIDVTDSSGRAVATELAMALIQTSLLERFGRQQRSIVDAFSSGQRQHQMKNTSSCTFSYATATRSINDALLAETQRLSRLSAEEESLSGLSRRHIELGFAIDEAPMPAIELAEQEILANNGPETWGRRGDAVYFADGDNLGDGLPNVDFDIQDALMYRFQDFRTLTESRWMDQTERSNLHWRFSMRERQLDANAGLTLSRKLMQGIDRTINGLTADGRFFVAHGLDDEQIRQLTATEGVRLFGSKTNGETGFWDPVIATDENGHAELEITMPSVSTAWTLSVNAISAETLTGTENVQIVTRKNLFGLLTLPPSFTAGDKADIKVEVHHVTAGERTISVKLRSTMGEQTVEQNRSLPVTGPGIETLEFPVQVGESAAVEFELLVATEGEPQDVIRSTVQILPYGFPIYQSASGTASQNTVAMIQWDAGQQPQGQTLELVIGGNVNQLLLDSLLRSDSLLPLHGRQQHGRPTGQLSRSLSDCVGGVAVLDSIGRSAQQEAPVAARVSELVVSAVSNLVASQRDDGGWSRAGHSQGDANAILTARVMWSLQQARSAGFAVPNDQFERGIAVLKQAFANQPDLNRQSMLLAAIAECGAGDFALANRLYRERNRLDALGLVHLMLSLASLKHNDMALELIPLIQTQATQEKADGIASATEITALQMIALQRMNVRPELRSTLGEQLLRTRVGARWPIESDNGAAIAALAAHFGSRPSPTEKLALTIYVNGHQLEPLSLEPGSASHRIKVPNEFLDVPQHKIEFELSGRGEFSYSAVLSGFVAADSINSTTNDWSISRRYEPAEIRLEGREILRGYDVVNGSYSWVRNELTQLPVGVRGQVTLTPRVRYQDSRPLRAELMLIDPIPAGCTILEDTINGVYDRYEIAPGAITFFIGDSTSPGDIHYSIAGYLPGTYRTAPAVLRSFFSPAKIAVSKPAVMQVLRFGEQSTDAYHLTPDELFAIGQDQYNKGEYQQAHDSLSTLSSKWTLDEEPYKQSVALLFRASMQLDQHADSVKYFEVIKERFPDVELTFEEIQLVALAYREIAEYERSYLVYRTTVQASFEMENQVAGFLNARGEFVRSVQTMESLLRDYPAESYVSTASYALAQEVYRRAETVHDDPRLVEAGLTRTDLVDSSIRMLDDFITLWPDDPSSDQASFALATALIDLHQFQLAIQRSSQYALRYPSSRLLDSYWYMIGFCYFELQDHAKALEVCRKVAEATFPDERSGSIREADNKWEAVYIMGQIHHSLGQAAQAIEQYSRVSERFKDAAEAIEFFSRKSVSIADVTTLLPDDAKQLRLQHRNLKEVDLKVYRIDLMKFGLMQRNLDRITAINLAGIKPHHQETIQLGDGNDFRNRETTVALPLDELGAYLVVCRGENLYASGLVVVSPLSLSVEEDAVSGRVRVSVKDQPNDSFVGEVHVKVIGSANESFVSGDTDLRGLFIADGIKGTSTVIAVNQNDQYAFQRGQIHLQDDPVQDTLMLQQQMEPANPSYENEPLLNNLFMKNSIFQQEQKLNIDGLMNNGRQGVQSKEAY